MIIETKNKTINLVFKTRKIVDIANLLKNKNFEEAFIKSYSECSNEDLSKIIFKLAEDDNGKSSFKSSDEVYDFIDDCRASGIRTVDLYKMIAEALNEEGFFKKKMTEKELKEMTSNILSSTELNNIVKKSAETAMNKMIVEEFQGYRA